MLPDILDLVKRRRPDILLLAFVLLLSLLSFGIGYLKARQDLKQPLMIEDTSHD